MAAYQNIGGTTETSFGIGIGAQAFLLKQVGAGAAARFRNRADGAFVRVQGADSSTADDFVTRRQAALLGTGGVSEKYGIARFTDTTGQTIEDSQVRMYPEGAADPVPGGGVPSPTAGDLYFNTAIKHWMYYDATRSKWLSIDSNAFQCGNNGNVPTGTYLRGIAGNLLGAASGYVAQYNGTVVGLSWSRGDADASNWQIMASGVQIASVATAATAGYDNALNANFSQGAVLAVRNDAAGNIVSDPQVWVWVKWRPT